MRSRLLLVGLGVLVGVAAGIGGTFVVERTTPSDHTHLVDQSDSFGGIVVRSTKDSVYTFALGRVCVDGAKTVTIDAIRLVRTTGNITTGAFGLVTSRAIADSAHEDLAHYASREGLGYLAGSAQSLSTRCTRDQLDARDVAVELTASSLPAVVAGFDVDYRVGADRRTMRIANGFTMCGPRRSDSKATSFIDGLDSTATAADCADFR